MQFFVVVNICVCVIFTDPPAVVEGYNEGHVVVSQSDVKVIVPGHIVDPVGSTALCEERVQIFGEDSGQHEQQQQDVDEEQFPALHRQGALYHHAGDGMLYKLVTPSQCMLQLTAL